MVFCLSFNVYVHFSWVVLACNIIVMVEGLVITRQTIQNLEIILYLFCKCFWAKCKSIQTSQFYKNILYGPQYKCK